MKKKYLIILIVFFAFILRAAKISFVPPSLNWDEVSHGYNAYSILKTGKDEWGKRFPIIFRAYGDYKLPVYIYLTVFSEAILGMSELSVRLPSILAGTASVLFTYLLVNQLFKNKQLSILAALLIALEPWGLFISRIASEANLSVFLIIAGTYFFVKKKLPLSAVFFGLSVWTYNSARIFVPTFLVALVIIYKNEILKFAKKHQRNFAFSILILAMFMLPMFYQLANPTGQARYKWVAILDQGMISEIVNNRSQSKLPAPLPRLIHNKATYFGKSFVINYFSHFSPEFLFFKGGSDYQFSVPNHEILYLVNLPFFVIGLLTLLKQFKKKNFSKVVFAWLCLAPIASSLTREAPHVLRDIIILPMPMIFTAFGLVSAWTYLKKKKLMRRVVFIVYGVVFFLSFERYATAAATEYRTDYSWSWQYGYKQAVAFAKESYDDYDKIIITKKYGEPHEFFLFYWPWDPGSFQNDEQLIRFFQSDWYWVDRFDKFYFVNDWQVEDLVTESGEEIDCADSKCLLISSPNNFPTGWVKLETINFLDNQPAFEIHEN